MSRPVKPTFSGEDPAVRRADRAHDGRRDPAELARETIALSQLASRLAEAGKTARRRERA